MHKPFQISYFDNIFWNLFRASADVTFTSMENVQLGMAFPKQETQEQGGSSYLTAVFYVHSSDNNPLCDDASARRRRALHGKRSFSPVDYQFSSFYHIKGWVRIYSVLANSNKLIMSAK